MYKVTLEVTHEYYEWKVWNGEECVATHKMVRDNGGAKGIMKYGVFEGAVMALPAGDLLLEGIEDGDPFDIMTALRQTNEEDEDWPYGDEEDEWDDEEEDDAETDSDDGE